MEQPRYILMKGNKKFICPDCCKKTFVPFVDTITGDQLPDNYGRCDREINCAYFLSPYKDGYNKPITFNDVYYGDVYLSAEKRLYDGAFTTLRLALHNISHQAIFFPKNVFKNFTYNITYKYAADYDYNLRVWGGYRQFCRVNLTTVLFDQNGQGSNNEDVNFLKNKLSITVKSLGFISATLVFIQRIKCK